MLGFILYEALWDFLHSRIQLVGWTSQWEGMWYRLGAFRQHPTIREGMLYARITKGPNQGLQPCSPLNAEDYDVSSMSRGLQLVRLAF